MDRWGFERLRPWLGYRTRLPVGPLFCIIDGPTRGRPWAADAARSQLRRLAAAAGVRRRFAPHQLRHAHAVELAHEVVPLNVIQRQLGHTNLGVTSIYLQGIDNAGDHRHRPLTARANDPSHHRTQALTPIDATDAGRPPLPLPSKSSTVRPRACSSSQAATKSPTTPATARAGVFGPRNHIDRC